MPDREPSRQAATPAGSYSNGPPPNPLPTFTRRLDKSGFPAPAFGARTRSPLWRWADVAAWLGAGEELRERDRVIELVNAVLLAHSHARNEHERAAMGAMLLAH